MDRERFLRVEQIFQRALAVPGEQRAKLGARECGTDLELLREVQLLLAGDARADQGIERFQLFRRRDSACRGWRRSSSSRGWS
jgi:hypothetical protein